MSNKIILKKNKFIRVLFFCVLFFVTSIYKLRAEYQCIMSTECLKAQKLIFELNLDEADKVLEQASKSESNNIAVYWMKDASIFMRIFISDDESIFNQKSKEWLNMIQIVEKSKVNSAWYRLVLSDMYIHRALVKLKFGENFSAGSDVKTAFKLLKENKTQYPYFLTDNMNLGFLKCLFSSVPKKYQWLVKIAGCQGDMEEGLKEMKAYMNSGLSTNEHVYLQLETGFMYAMIQHHLNKNTDEAWNTIEPLTRNYKHNLLEAYMRATLAAYKGLNDQVIDVLTHKPAYSEGSPFYYTDYMLGLAKLRHLDNDAENYFLKFTVRYKGKNYVKSAYRYLSWIQQLKGDSKAAQTYYSICVKDGALNLEEDKQAFKESGEKLIWDVGLLKARLLYDGYYLDQSLKILKSIKEATLKNDKFKMELNYRLGRVYQAKKEIQSAIIYLEKTIELGKTSTFYYGAYSALQLGAIYEEKKDKVNAKKYYSMAKDEFKNNQEYVNSIEQKAKAGLKRLK
jgi:hypothetical protein